LFAHRGRGPAERLEHLLFTFGFNLLMRDRLPALTVDRFQRDHVIASEAGNRPYEQRLNPAPLADLAPHLARDLLIVRTLHQPEGLSGALFGEDVQIGRLFKLYRQALFERAVEDRIARGVDEVREQNRVLVSQRRPGGAESPAEVKISGGCGQDDDSDRG